MQDVYHLDKRNGEDAEICIDVFLEGLGLMPTPEPVCRGRKALVWKTTKRRAFLHYSTGKKYLDGYIGEDVSVF